MRTWKRVSIIAGLVALTSLAWAQEETSQQPRQGGWGLRVGLADDPDQVVVGAQFDLGEIADHVYLEPNVELGVGDDHTILTGACAVHYRFKQGDQVRPYAGGAVAIGFVDRDVPGQGGDTEFEIAVKALGGGRWPLKNQKEFFLELDLVFGDLHDVQIMAGWKF